MKGKSYRIESVYRLLFPLSHIGESESTTTFLNTIRVLNEGRVDEVFAYTGNALRGQWRDSGAEYLLNRLQVKVPKKTFHLLFSGGSISGEQVNDVAQVKALRDNLPFLSVFGGGVGNQILAGKIGQTFAYPICAETTSIIPDNNPHIDYTAQSISWRLMSGEIEFTRKDDGKTELGDKFLHDCAMPQLPEGKKGKKEKEKDSDGPATQMRYRVEYMAPNVQLWHMMNLICSEVELGALVASIHEWSKRPVLGGMSGKGFGLVDLTMDIVEQDGTRIPFITVADGALTLGDPAKDAKDRYDEHLKTLYDMILDSGRENLIALMEGGS